MIQFSRLREKMYFHFVGLSNDFIPEHDLTQHDSGLSLMLKQAQEHANYIRWEVDDPNMSNDVAAGRIL